MPYVTLFHACWCPKIISTLCRAGAVTRSVNQIAETWKSFDCGHSSEVVWPELKHRHNAQIWKSYLAESRHPFCSSNKHARETVLWANKIIIIIIAVQSDYISLPATCWFSPGFHTTESNIQESDGLQWLWMCITCLIVFNIIFLWGLFFSFILSAGWVNSFPVTACRRSSFKSTDKHRPQTGRREVTSYPYCCSFSEAALYKCSVWADYMTVHRAIIKVFTGPAPR